MGYKLKARYLVRVEEVDEENGIAYFKLWPILDNGKYYSKHDGYPEEYDWEINIKDIFPAEQQKYCSYGRYFRIDIRRKQTFKVILPRWSRRGINRKMKKFERENSWMEVLRKDARKHLEETRKGLKEKKDECCL